MADISVAESTDLVQKWLNEQDMLTVEDENLTEKENDAKKERRELSKRQDKHAHDANEIKDSLIEQKSALREQRAEVVKLLSSATEDEEEDILKRLNALAAQSKEIGGLIEKFEGAVGNASIGAETSRTHTPKPQTSNKDQCAPQVTASQNLKLKGTAAAALETLDSRGTDHEDVHLSDSPPKRGGLGTQSTASHPVTAAQRALIVASADRADPARRSLGGRGNHGAAGSKTRNQDLKTAGSDRPNIFTTQSSDLVDNGADQSNRASSSFAPVSDTPASFSTGVAGIGATQSGLASFVDSSGSNISTPLTSRSGRKLLKRKVDEGSLVGKDALDALGNHIDVKDTAPAYDGRAGKKGRKNNDGSDDQWEPY